MKQKLFLLLALFMVSMVSVNAQVTIGSDKEPHSAAVLDLQSEKKGLKLPSVMLDDDKTIFKLDPETDKTTAAGMTVYNTADKSVYVWNGETWKQITGGSGGSIGQGEIVLADLTASNGKKETEIVLKKGTPRILTVSYTPSTASNKGLIWNSSKPNLVEVDGDGKVTGLAETNSPVTVTATSMADASLVVTWKVTVNDVGQGVAPGEDIGNEATGNYVIMGATCYDVGQSNKNGSCGETRTGNFPDEESLKRKYYFTSTDGNFANLRVGYYDDTEGFLESVTYDGTGTVNGVVAFDVVFSSDVNNIAYGASPYSVSNKPKTAKIFTQFETSEGEKYVEMTITVQDCSCCPSGSSTISKAYTGPLISSFNATTNLSFAKISPFFTEIPKTKLCVWKSIDSGNQTWSNAKIRCENGNGLTSATTEEKTGDWRLPVLAELEQLKSTFGGTTYWSSTDRGGSSAWLWTSSYSYSYHPKTSGYPARCVRTIGN